MMTYIDEIDQSDHLETTFIEFIEAFFRVADLLCYPPKQYWEQNKTYDPNETTMKYQKLILKVENLLPVVH